LVTLQGDIYGGREQQVFTVTSPTLLPNGQFWKNETSRYGVQGGNVLGRWTHTFSEGSEVQVQAYFDRAERDLPVNPQANDTFDVEGQHRFQLGDRQEVVWGLGYRRMEDQLPGTYTMAFIPERRGMDLFSGFVQDEIGLVKEKLPLTLGVRVENNDFTGVEVQPNARLMWRMAERQSVWGAVSRAVRTPSRAESDALLHQPLGFPLMTEMRGNPEMAAEKELAYELGHRWQPHPRLALDTALFYQDYDELLSLEPGAPVVGFPTVIPVQAGNLMKGESYGVELAPRWQVTDWCRLEAAYTFLELNLHRLPGSGDTVSEGQEGQVPEHQVRLAARLDLDRHWQVDAAVRYVGELPDFGIRAYVAVDARLAWLPRSNIEVAVVGQSLLDDRHPEFTTSRLGTQSTEVERSVFARLTVRF
jgi:iron complex outermembrane receptor protein